MLISSEKSGINTCLHRSDRDSGIFYGGVFEVVVLFVNLMAGNMLFFVDLFDYRLPVHFDEYRFLDFFLRMTGFGLRTWQSRR